MELLTFHGSIIILFLSLSTLLLRSESSEAPAVPAIFVFGDSLVDVGNNNYLRDSTTKANFPHNGVDFPAKEPTGRFSNGMNIADFLAEKVGLPSPPPYLSLVKNKKWEESDKRSNGRSLFINGINFASGGARILKRSDQKLHQSIPLTQQLTYYYETVYRTLVKKLGPPAAANHLSKSLFLIVIGSNDILEYLGSSELPKQYTPQQYIASMINILKEQIELIHRNSGRKIIITRLDIIGCTPSIRAKNPNEDCNEQINSLAGQYNIALKSMLSELKLNGMVYSYFETYNVTQNIFANQTTYGFTEVKEACCGLGKLKAEARCEPTSDFCPNRTDHLFWDMFHPTQATSRIFADTLFDGPSNYTVPFNVSRLVAI